MQEAPFKGDLSHSKRCLLEHVIVEPDSLKFEGHMLKGVVSRAKAFKIFGIWVFGDRKHGNFVRVFTQNN